MVWDVQFWMAAGLDGDGRYLRLSQWNFDLRYDVQGAVRDFGFDILYDGEGEAWNMVDTNGWGRAESHRHAT